MGRAGVLGRGRIGAAGEGDAMKPLSAAALIAGGLLGWYAAGAVAARVDSVLLPYAGALGLGVLLALGGAWLLARRRR